MSEVQVPRSEVEVLVGDMRAELGREMRALVARSGEKILFDDPEVDRRWEADVERICARIDQEFRRRLDELVAKARAGL